MISIYHQMKIVIKFWKYLLDGIMLLELRSDFFLLIYIMHKQDNICSNKLFLYKNIHNFNLKLYCAFMLLCVCPRLSKWEFQMQDEVSISQSCLYYKWHQEKYNINTNRATTCQSCLYYKWYQEKYNINTNRTVTCQCYFYREKPNLPTFVTQSGQPHSVLSNLWIFSFPDGSTVLSIVSIPTTLGFMGLGYFCHAAWTTVSHGWLNKSLKKNCNSVWYSQCRIGCSTHSNFAIMILMTVLAIFTNTNKSCGKEKVARCKSFRKQS